MSGRTTAVTHAGIDDLEAVRVGLPADLVALRAGDTALFLADGNCGKDAVLRCLARWTAQVEALPDHHTDGTP